MNTSIDNLQPGQQPASSGNKPLWAAVGVLSVAVLGMGGTMLYNQRAQTSLAPAATVAAVTPPQAVATPQLAAPAASANPANAADDLAEKPVAAPAKPAPAKKVVKPVPKPAPAPSYSGASPAPYPAPAPAVAAAPVCAVCGSVESVTPVERSSKPAGPGAGAVAGGVLGAVLGNQVGHGGGRTAATILGAVGGGFAGNAIEGHMRKETVYQVGVRMEDGSRRMLEVARAPSVGSRVTVEGATLRTSDGVAYGPKPPPAPVAPQPSPTEGIYGR
ncbi:MAG TPA: glycine zipper 2TM domain-containing protein [Polaromonas sp.]|jgi:outer membrane lipoprotein SlyB